MRESKICPDRMAELLELLEECSQYISDSQGRNILSQLRKVSENGVYPSDSLFTELAYVVFYSDSRMTRTRAVSELTSRIFDEWGYDSKRDYDCLMWGLFDDDDDT